MSGPQRDLLIHSCATFSLIPKDGSSDEGTSPAPGFCAECVSTVLQPSQDTTGRGDGALGRCQVAPNPLLSFMLSSKSERAEGLEPHGQTRLMPDDDWCGVAGTVSDLHRAEMLI